jgi:glucose/mannose-6-phosphate isomerase
MLDELAKIKKIDQDNLAQIMGQLKDQLDETLKDEAKINLPDSYQNIKNVVIVGMGCDRVVADLIKRILYKKSTIPVEVISDYEAPFYINDQTLLLFLSYSGNTFEVLHFLNQVLEKNLKPKILSILGGGQLEKICQKEKLPFYKFKGTGPSRANFGYLLFGSLVFLKKIEKLKIAKENLEQFKEIMGQFNKIFLPQEKTENNIAKFLACQIFDRMPIIVGGSNLFPVAARWKKELNENSKVFSFAEEAPEFFHNSIVGLEFPWLIRDEVFFIFLESNFYPAKLKKSFELFKKILTKEKILFETINPFGQNEEEEMLGGLILGDWVSFYLAMLNKVNPTPVENINQIKSQLNKV